jgi:hypothetical protein
VGPRAVLTVAGVLLLAVAGVLLVLAGGDDEPEDGSAGAHSEEAGPRSGTAAEDEAPGGEDPPPVPADANLRALRSARALASGFERVTGDRLRLDPNEFFTSAAFHDRTLDEHGQAEAYYGNFLLSVYPTPGEARDALRSEGRWSSYGAGFYGRTRLGDVVVQSVFQRRRTDGGWERLLRALRAARDPARAAALLPAGERLCSRRGIRLESGPVGTCKRGPQLFVIRQRGMGLRLPGFSMEDVLVRSGRGFGGRDGFPERARGVFVEVRFGMRNTGRKPIELRPTYELLLGGRRFEEATAVFGLRDRYPLKPGEVDSEVTLFDVPRELAARDELQRAALQVPGDPAENFAVTDGMVVGHLRLAGPVGRLRVQPEREPPPLPPAPPPPPEPEPEPLPPPDPGVPPAIPA